MQDTQQNNTVTGIKAGDPSDTTTDSLGGVPYCFRLKTEHEDGAFEAVAKYKPWWSDLKDPWNKELKDVQNQFRIWTKQKEKLATVKTLETHAVMNGGKLRISFGDDERLFLQYYAKCLLAGHRLFFVEQFNESPIFRYFVDLDFKQLSGITERGVEAAAYVCAKCVSEFFKEPSTCIVSSTTHKKETDVDAQGTTISMMKTGVHLHWPHYYVTCAQALQIRVTLITELTEAFGPRCKPSMNVWEDVVDKSVYKGSGLRMIGSLKATPCKACKNKKGKKESCSECVGFGIMCDTDMNNRPTGRPYMMLCVLSPVTFYRDTTLEQMYLNDFHKLVVDTKIRTNYTEDSILYLGFTIPKGAELYLDDDCSRQKHKRQKLLGNLGRTIEATDPLHFEVQACIRESFGPLYAQVQVRKISKGPKQYTVQVRGINSQYCQNIGRQHQSNNIYFVISRDGIVQRCFDNGELTNEMKHGLCSTYSSSCIAVSVAVNKLLWPEHNDTITVFASEKSTSLMGSFAMRALLNAGEYLSLKLFNTSWTSTLGLQSSKTRKGLKDFIRQDSRDLGTKGIEAYKDLGMSWADALIDSKLKDIGTPTEHQRNYAFRTSIADLEKEVLEHFLTIVVCASTNTDPETNFAMCSSMDHFLGSEMLIAHDDADDGLYYV